MQIVDLKQLALYVGRTSYTRGVTYARRGDVHSVRRRGDHLEAEVCGSRPWDYTTELLLDGRGRVKRSSCTCPMAAACKHVAALGYALEKGLVSLEEEDAPEHPLRPGMGKAELEAWAREHDVLGWTRVRADRVDATWWYGADTVADVLTRKAVGRTRQVARRLVDALLEAADGAAEGRAWEEQHADLWEVAPSDELLADAWSRLVAARAGLRAEAATPRVPNPEATLELDEEAGALVYREPVRALCGDVHDPRLVVSLQGTPQVRCACATAEQGRCSVAVSALTSCLELLADEEAPLRAEVLRYLETPAWERELALLDRVLGGEETAGDPQGRKLGWSLGYALGELFAQPVLVRPYRRKPGLRVWHRVRNDELEQACTEERDRQLLAAWRRRDPGAAGPFLELLAGHPRVLAEGTNTPIRVRSAELELRWRATRGGGVELVPMVDGERLEEQALQELAELSTEALWTRHRDGELIFARLTRPQQALLAHTTRRGGTFPPVAVPELMQRLERFEAVAPVRLDPQLRGREVDGAASALVKIEPRPDGSLGLRLRLRILPGAPAVVPGAGSEELYAFVAGERVFVARDHSAERRQASALVAALDLDPVRSWSWDLDDPERALEVLAALRDLPDPPELAWSGPPKRLSREATADDLALRLGQRKDWFGLEGTLSVDGLELPLAELLEAIRDGRRFVRLGEQGWIRLSDGLRRQLEATARAARARAGGLEVSPLVTPALEALEEAGAELEAPPTWRLALERLEQSRTLEVEAPPELRAELRPYQLDGLRWLARTAHWAPGACLADDMGLGKTVQALALLLRRSAVGPSLVVAPTSVGPGWIREAARFAPSLAVRAYRGQGRERLLAELDAGEVLVTSYDILLRDADALAGVGWGTVVFDEAQALKNATTKRARAATRLEAGFRLALTGTPVENRVGELWSLFATIAPGWLGSKAHFKERFVGPIEGKGDEGARRGLAALARPLILRRLKAAVAPELPPRTEIVERVRLSAGERALYDQVRVAALTELDEQEAGRIQILAALTRLRQLACHPRLALPDSRLPSSKLEAALELLRRLRDEGHRALVFSQFTRHLALVREALEAEGFRLRYLDGGTSQRARQREIDAFQAGDGDVFLISLKAGGTGLNLTAASYVLHLDPWWNPAVEDQATDRAHRIGQRLPVTVYRLIAEGTVEEAILELHGEKRELAEALLSGTSASSLMSTAELLGLMAGAGEVEVVERQPDEPEALDALLERFEAALDEELRAGRLARKSSVRAYKGAIRRLVAWTAEREGAVTDVEQLLGSWEAYRAAIVAGELETGKSDKVWVKPAIGRLRGFLDGAWGATP